jgi:acetyltransferase-like isoleucine patch superfamily enzyme
MTMLAKVLGYIRRMSGGLASRYRNMYYKALGVEIQGYVWMRRISIPRNFSEILLANNVALDEGVTLLAVGGPGNSKKIAIGEGTYINRATFIDASHEVRIGRNVGIGPRCYITDHDHGTAPGTPIMDQPLISTPTVISDGVWLGAGCIVLKGVTIGKDTIVGAGSIVVRDLPPDSVAIGRPARAVRNR